MLKRTLEAPPKNGTIAGYTSELSRFLRGGVPGERADKIVQEAHAHLLDRADAIAQAENVPHGEAEARAVAAFTPAVTFAREMAQSAYETGHSKAWRTMGGAVAVSLLCCLFCLLLGQGFSTSITPFLFEALLPLIGLCAFQARRTQTRQFLVWGTCAAVFTFFYAGLFYLDGAPTDTPLTPGTPNLFTRRYNNYPDPIKSKIGLLEIGLQTFGGENTFVPATLKSANSDGYLVPSRYYRHYERSVSFRFLTNSWETVPTQNEARTRWQADGPLWLVQNRRVQAVNRGDVGPLQIALHNDLARTAPYYAGVMGAYTMFLIICDALFAVLGRIVYLSSRSRRKTKRAWQLRR